MNQTIGVNITPQSFQPTLHYSQGDVGRVFVINVTDYDIPTGATVTCVATKPSGMGFTVSGTVSGNSVTFTSTAEMTDEWGRFPAEIRIASGNTLLGTANFLMIGEKDPHPASTIDGTQEELIPQLTLLVNRVEAAAESVHDLTVSATTLTAGSDATATYDSTNNSIAFGIPRGADGDVTRSEFNDLKSDINAITSEDRLTLHFKWEHGGIDGDTGKTNNDGSLTRSRDVTYYSTKDVYEITNLSSVNVWVCFYRTADENSFFRLQGIAPSKTYQFSGDSYFRVDVRGSLQIAQSVIGKRSYSALFGDVQDAKLNANVGRFGIYTIPNSDIEQGGSEDGVLIYDATRIRGRTKVHVQAGDILHFVGGATTSHLSITQYTMNGSFVSAGGYVTSCDYQFTAERLVLLKYKNTDGSNIVPSDYDATTQIISVQTGLNREFQKSIVSDKLKVILTSDNDIEILANGTKLQFLGSNVYVLGLKTGARKLVSYSDIATQVPTYCTVNSSGLLIEMPACSVFGYDIDNEVFAMRTGETSAYAISANFVPLYYRYYNTVFGDLVDRYIYKKVIKTAESKTIVRQSFNSAYHEGVTDFATKCSQFCFLMYGDGVVNVDAPTDIESFLFFTDPHLAMFSGWEDEFCEKLACIQKYYNSTPTSFCLCGGDWLGTSDLPSEACFKMGYIDGVMRSMFKDSYMLVGNHDTNYIGKLTPESEQYTTSLSNESIANLWYRKDRKAYFKFEGDATAFYCFDTGVEAQQLSSQNDYGYTQLEWFANSLLTEEKPHIAVTAHILFYNNEQALQPLTDQVLSIARAYNSRESIFVNNVLYDFETATGKIEFGLFGHTHSDYNGVIKGIPCVITTNVRRAVSPTFDLVMADYTNRVLHLIRVGEGEDRDISLT